MVSELYPVMALYLQRPPCLTASPGDHHLSSSQRQLRSYPHPPRGNLSREEASVFLRVTQWPVVQLGFDPGLWKLHPPMLGCLVLRGSLAPDIL